MAVTRQTLAELTRQAHTIEHMLDSQTRDLSRRWVKAWDAINAAIEAAVTQALMEGDDAGVSRIIAQQKAAQALRIATATLTGLLQQSAILSRQGARRLIAQATTDQLRLVGTQLPSSFDLSLIRTDSRQMAAIGRRSLQQITVRHHYLNARATEAMKHHLTVGVSLGQNPRDVTAKKMVDAVQGEFEGGLARAQVIARTEQLDAYRAAAKASDRAMSDILDCWIWHAELGSRTCFPAGTMVTTDHDCVPIEQLETGDVVLTHTGKFRKITETMSRPYTGRMVTITTPVGQVTSTGDHPFLVERQGKLNWVEAREVRAGDRIFSDRKSVSDGPHHPIGERPVELGVGDPKDRVAARLHEPVLAGIPSLGVPVPVGAVDFNDDRAVKQEKVDRVVPRSDRGLLLEGDAQLSKTESDVPLRLGLSRVPAIALGRAETAAASRTRLDPEFLTARQTHVRMSRPSALLGAMRQSSLSAVEELPACLAWLNRRASLAAILAPLGRDAGVGSELGAAVNALRVSAAALISRPASAGAIFAGPLHRHGERLSAWAHRLHARGSDSASPTMRMLLLMLRIAGRRAVPAIPLSDLRWGGIESGVTDFASAFHGYMVSSVTDHYQSLTVHNVEVDQDHSYVADGVVVHNCPSCLAQHGTRHPMDEDGPIDHHQGRCTRLPVTKTWSELGFEGITEPDPHLTPQAGDGVRWLQSQPAATQEKILGPKRYDAWRDGRYPPEDWSVRKTHWSEGPDGKPRQDWRDSMHVGPVRKPGEKGLPPVEPHKV